MSKNNYPHTIYTYKGLQRLLLCLILMCFLTKNINAQQFNNWYFPNYAGITFNTNPPSFLLNSKAISGSSASISDNNGNLLFYTDGYTVFNKLNNIMTNGDSLNGYGNQAGGTAIIPIAGTTGFYYILNSDGITYGNGINNKGYTYNIVNMNLQGGLGELILKNKRIGTYNSSEKIAFAINSNGSDIWYITRGWGNDYYSYKLSCFGLDTLPTITNIGVNTNNNLNNLFGVMKASINGKFLANAYIKLNKVELLKFNNTNGLIESVISIPISRPFGVEFSPDSKLLYVCSDTAGFAQRRRVSQYKIDLYDSTIIVNSRILLSDRNNDLGGAAQMQIGPDNKIYVANGSNYYLDVIENPAVYGLGANYLDTIIYLGGRQVSRNLPFIPPFLFTAQNVQINYTVAPDCRTVTLTGKTYVKGNNLTFKWKFGDGDSTVQILPSGGDTTFASVTHFYPLGIDTFNVQLFVTSDTVCGQGSAGKKVIVKPPRPTAKFGYSITCNQQLVTFTDSSLLNFNPSLSYQWQFFNKNNVLLGNSVAANTSFSFPTYDTFLVRLIVRSPLACVQADTLTKTIVLKAKPVANFTFSNTCGSLAATFINTSFIVADTLASYYWSFGDGTISFTKNPNHNYAAYGSYTVKLVVNSSLGCRSDTVSLPVLIKAKPVANFIYSNNGCAGSAVLLQDSAYVTNSSIATHFWQLPNGNSFNTVHINPSFFVGGSYAIKYTVTSALGCGSDTLVKSIFIESIPTAAIAAITGGCVNEVLNFTSNSSIAFGSINNYQWKFTATDSSTQQNTNANFNFTNAGNYTIQHRVVSKQGCVSNTTSLPIAIHSKPIAAFSNGLVCLGKQVNFLNESSNAFGAIVNTEWTISNTIVSNGTTGFTYTFNQSGNYAVALKVSTANGCSSLLNKPIIVEPAFANAGKDTTVLENQPFVLQGSGGVNYLWQPPIGLDDATKANAIGVLNNNQQYILTIITAQGCVGFDTVLIKVLRNLKIPNAFSPNGDGINETWNIEQLKDYPNAEVQIFNRNGQLLYVAKGNNIAAWMGSINNKPVPVGAYYYVITLNNALRNKPFSGWVMVVR